MKKFGALLAVLFAVSGLVQAESKKEENKVEKKVEKTAESVLNVKMKGIDGKDVDLSTYKGKVVLFVNVASKCGYTKQYKGLQALNEKYSKEGLVIIGVPCNQFGSQEPGTDKDIVEFCESKYKVTFPLLSKVNVNDDKKDKDIKACPLYKALTEQKGGDIKWNFTKFLIGKNGEIVDRFEPAVAPEASKLTEKIEAELKK